MSNLTECYKSNIYNPMMNYLPFDKTTKLPACLRTCLSTYNETYPFIKPILCTELAEEVKYWNDQHTTKLEEITGIPRIYTMPVTTSAPDSIEFAKLLYGNTSIIRDNCYPINYNDFLIYNNVDKNIKQLLPEVNQNLLPEVNQNLLPEMNQTIEDNKFFCKSNADNTVNLDRLSYYPNDPYYQKINNKKYNYINYY